MKKGWHNLKKTDLEKKLEEETKKAAEVISKELNIPKEVYEKNFPIIRFDPFSETPYFHLEKNEIVYCKQDDTDAIYEETMHAIHKSFQKSENGYVKKNGFFLDRFFCGAIVELTGFFAPAFFGKERENDGLLKLTKQFNEQGMRKKAISETNAFFDCINEQKPYEKKIETEFFHLTVGNSIYNLMKYFIENEEELPKEELFVRFVEKAGERMHHPMKKSFFSGKYFGFERLSGIEKKFYALPNELFDDIMNFMLVENFDENIFNWTYSLIGYDLGESIYELYKSDKTEAKKIIIDLMRTPTEKSTEKFIEIEKSLYNTKYSPIRKLEELNRTN
jgi:hypothetical protein